MAEQTVGMAATLKPAMHQVGGHMGPNEQPCSCVDDQGRFYKLIQAGPKGLREVEFYQNVYGTTNGSNSSMAEVRLEDVASLKPFLPGFYGTVDANDGKYLIMEDICKPYRQPCVIDCKIGYTSVYEAATEAYKQKNIAKDKETTQGSIGFRISGLQVYKKKSGTMYKPGRQYGKTLTPDTITEAFTLFADNDALAPKELYHHPNGVVERLRKLEKVFDSQQSFQFYQASVLLTYEGEASNLDEANLQVRLVDFAHTFPSNGQKDLNFLTGLQSLISILQRIE